MLALRCSRAGATKVSSFTRSRSTMERKGLPASPPASRCSCKERIGDWCCV